MPENLFRVFVLVAGLCLAPIIVAQQPALPDTLRGLQIERDDRDRQAAPQFLPESPSPDFELPPIPPADASAGIASGLSVMVLEIVVQGSTVLRDEIANVVTPYVGRRLTSADLQNLRHRLTSLYIDNGYVNSGVILPDQRADQGRIVFRAIEGTLAEIVVESEGRLRKNYIRERIDISPNEPLQVDELRDQLVLLQADPLVGSLRSELRPSAIAGDGILEIRVDEARAWQLDASIANDRSPSIGAVGANAGFAHRNLTGFGDALTVGAGRTDGLDDISMKYSFPITRTTARLALSYRSSESTVVEQPFDEIDIDSHSEDIKLAVSYPLVKSLNQALKLEVSLAKRRSATSLLGRPFSFSPGVENGRSRVTVLRTGFDWTRRSQNDVFAVRGTLSTGFDAWNSTKHNDLPDSKFLAMLGQVQWAHRFREKPWQLLLRSSFQLTDDALLPLEQFAVGGVNTVRGYRENQFVRDQGIILSAEFRMSVLPDSIGKTQLYAFADHGRAWNHTVNTGRNSIGSMGAGLRWQTQNGWYLDVAAALPFRKFDVLDETLQDKGVHFLVGYSTPR